MIELDDETFKKYLKICGLIFLALVLLALIIVQTTALKIIPEDPFENKSLELCTLWYNTSTSNKTLDCVNFLLDLRRTNDTTTIIHNYTSNETKDYIDSQLKNLSEFMTYDEYTNSIEELHHKIKNELINELNISPSNEAQAKRDHEFRMKELELNPEPDAQAQNLITKEDLALEISKALTDRSPPQSQSNPIIPENPGSYWLYIILVIIILGFCYKIFVLDKSHPPPSRRTDPPEGFKETAPSLIDKVGDVNSKQS